ncbi:MAG: putative toxin-antitoxin system toxin component, PIN family [Okeania sp. SIO3I5]|uniref:putative toxin-antitoxin system toxin component, PIN family n=1 Tax=Okeania sp. SIO3I5 TaxID=2607805 RepID=UPI0013BB3670|nr:putative toxin-antitoxin system toxin component, PIN family [Okeania sp. SIO3I5]NEQ40030.1 putative toxin-antitoxin system toxin component, PIN family [Okeania sp. SIO3I5]
MRVLVDTNIILDAFLEREAFVQDAKTLLTAIKSQQIEGYVAATTLTDIFYIVIKKTKSLERAREAVSMTLALMEICDVNSNILETAFASNLRDFEDAVQLVCAYAENLDAIITRNADDFVDASLPILSVQQLFEQSAPMDN